MIMDNLIVYMFVNSCWLWHNLIIIRLNCIQIHRKNLHRGGGGGFTLQVCVAVKTPLFAPGQHL